MERVGQLGSAMEGDKEEMLAVENEENAEWLSGGTKIGSGPSSMGFVSVAISGDGGREPTAIGIDIGLGLNTSSGSVSKSSSINDEDERSLWDASFKRVEDIKSRIQL